LNSSTMATLWSTDKATIAFIAPGVHTFSLADVDLCATTLDCVSDTFAWDGLNITGEQMTISGGTSGKGALYVDSLIGSKISGDKVTNISRVNGLNLCYPVSPSDNGYLGGKTYTLETATGLIPIGSPAPIPGAFWLLVRGFATLACMRRRLGTQTLWCYLGIRISSGLAFLSQLFDDYLESLWFSCGTAVHSSRKLLVDWCQLQLRQISSRSSIIRMTFWSRS